MAAAPPNLATILARLRLNTWRGFGATRPPCKLRNSTLISMITAGASEKLIHPKILSSMPRVASLIPSVESKLQQFGLSQRQVSNEMPDTPVSSWRGRENLLGQARTKELGLVANVVCKVRKTCQELGAQMLSHPSVWQNSHFRIWNTRDIS